MRQRLLAHALCIGLVLASVVVSAANASYDQGDDVVPITIGDNRMPIVPVSINGSGPYRFLLDTGSNRTAVSAALAQRLGVESLGRTNVKTATGAIALEVVALRNLTVGRLTKQQLPALILSDDQRRALNIDGLLGQDVLMTQSHTIDYRRRLLLWHITPQSGVLPPKGSSVAIKYASGMWLAELPQDDGGMHVVSLVPDSGAQALVLFEANLPASLQLSPLPDVTTSTFSGRTITGAARVRRLRVGPVVHFDEPAVIVRRIPDAAEGHGLLPLSAYDRVTFDAQRGYMIIGERAGSARPSPLALLDRR